MAVVAPATPDLTGEGAGFVAAAAGGDSFLNTGREMLLVRNAHASLSRTVTVDSPGTCSFDVANNAAHDIAVVVTGLTGAPLNFMLIGPFPIARFGASVAVSYSDSAADLTVAVIKPA